MKNAADAVAAARALVGVRFRPQGRGRTSGLDCIGLVVEAFDIDAAPVNYDVRGEARAELEAGLSMAGFAPAADRKGGDVLAMRSAPGQLHLGVWTGHGIVHADARLRRVVERPGEPPWPVLGTWRPVAGRG